MTAMLTTEEREQLIADVRQPLEAGEPYVCFPGALRSLQRLAVDGAALATALETARQEYDAIATANSLSQQAYLDAARERDALRAEMTVLRSTAQSDVAIAQMAQAEAERERDEARESMNALLAASHRFDAERDALREEMRMREEAERPLTCHLRAPSQFGDIACCNPATVCDEHVASLRIELAAHTETIERLTQERDAQKWPHWWRERERKLQVRIEECMTTIIDHTTLLREAGEALRARGHSAQCQIRRMMGDPAGVVGAFSREAKSSPVAKDVCICRLDDLTRRIADATRREG